MQCLGLITVGNRLALCQASRQPHWPLLSQAEGAVLNTSNLIPTPLGCCWPEQHLYRESEISDGQYGKLQDSSRKNCLTGAGTVAIASPQRQFCSCRCCDSTSTSPHLLNLSFHKPSCLRALSLAALLLWELRLLNWIWLNVGCIHLDKRK